MAGKGGGGSWRYWWIHLYVGREGGKMFESCGAFLISLNENQKKKNFTLWNIHFSPPSTFWTWRWDLIAPLCVHESRLTLNCLLKFSLLYYYYFREVCNFLLWLLLLLFDSWICLCFKRRYWIVCIYLFSFSNNTVWFKCSSNLHDGIQMLL